jgi:long-subunit acyl-CoA synthetase (AMP-forming)
MNKLIYADLLHDSLVKNANLPCLHIKRAGHYQSWTYTDFYKDLNRLCSILRKHGLKKGTNAIVVGENSPEWIIAFHGIILTGACSVPIDPNIPPSEIESIVTTTEAKIVFCSKVYLKLFRALKEKYSFIERIVLLDAFSEEKEPHFEKYLSHGNEDKDAFVSEFNPNDPMVIIFTSGTTGKAKGVVLSQKNYTVVSRYAVPRMQMNKEDTVCAVLP